MITPRTTRLVRVADLQGLQRTLIDLLPSDPSSARDSAVIVPSHGAAEELRRTIENVTLTASDARVLPDLVTREDFYLRLAQRLAGAPALLNPFEREVLLRRAAREASAAGAEPPFHVRPGLIVEILALYDELRRRHKTVADFERLLLGALEASADQDRGAARLLQQTVFLAAAFKLFESAVAETGRADEHALRSLALRSPTALYRHVVVTVGDQAADTRGLWTADFDLLARLPGLERIDIVATESLLATGLHERLHDLLPGIEEIRVESSAAMPILVVPDSSSSQDQPRAFVYRDREEELAAVARAIKEDPRRSIALDRIAVVFQRPLPYLYLARQVFADARIPYQASDSLPLAAEPFAATIDVIFAVLSGDFTRAALVELLRCPHLRFGSDGRRIEMAEIAALDRHLVERKYLGRVERLRELASQAEAEGSARCLQALQAARDAANELTAAIDATTAPDQIDALLGFLSVHEERPRPTDEWHARHMRARGAVLSALEMLCDAHAAHDSARLSIGELSGAVRRWIEGQTFSPRLGARGLSMMDAAAAAFSDVDELRLVGLIEGDWPERTSRSIFYPMSLLAQLGWPSEQDRLSAARARFLDLLRLPRRRISLSAFNLEDDALVSPSSMLDDVDAVGLRMERRVEGAATRVFTHEALALEPVVFTAVSGDAGRWLSLRASRSFDEDRFQGSAGARNPTAYAVSHVERYLDCPFRYFAAYVLRLPEERDEEAWMTPQERGQFVHEVFCEFFTEWQRLGRGSITSVNVAEAVALFDRIAETRLAMLPEGDRALERTLLLGSAAAPGLAERAFAFEIEHDVPVVERLLEYELRDTFEFAGAPPRRVEIRSKADRIDLLQDGSLRVIDYKLGRAPSRDRSLQLPVYGACATQALDGRHGRSWTVSRAGYVAFREKQAFVALGKNRDEVEKALTDGQTRMIEAIDGIEAGRFPPQPDDPFLCNWCAYPSVCRKDYVGDE